MKFEEYHLIEEPDNGWKFPNTYLDRINLIVGDSGTGKTRFINTVSNFSKQAFADKVKYSGNWAVVFSIGEHKYKWCIEVGSNEDQDEKIVKIENLYEYKNNDYYKILERSKDKFVYRDTKLPKLSRTVTAISLLKDESEIGKIYNGFKKVLTRRFFTNELNDNFALYSIPPNVIDKHKKKKDFNSLLYENIGFQNKIYLLKEVFPTKYAAITEFYKKAFPFIVDFGFFEFSDVQSHISLPFRARAFCFKEKNLDKWIPVNDISSGMQKVFLIVLDLYLMTDGGILLIDEYENSLGINAINLFPELIMNSDFNCQFIITSHHPYIINNIPIENWLVFHRIGLSVSIRSGKEFKGKFGKSKQQQFIQLINDPFYTQGIE